MSLCRYEELFDYPYTLPKLDILALPNYAFEAMENWGLVVFNQERIEIDPAESPYSERCWLCSESDLPSCCMLSGSIAGIFCYLASLWAAGMVACAWRFCMQPWCTQQHVKLCCTIMFSSVESDLAGTSWWPTQLRTS